MRKIIIISFILLIVLGMSVVVYRGTSSSSSSSAAAPLSEGEDLRTVEQYLADGKADEALEILSFYKSRVLKQTESGRQWRQLLIQAAVMKEDYRTLLALHKLAPNALDEHEKASILTSKAYLALRQKDKFDLIREIWKEKETDVDQWFLLDADRLLVEGENDQAIAFLESNTLEGKQDVERLLRLAMIYWRKNAKKSWEYLIQANQINPEDIRTRSMRARALEAIGQLEFARSEYIAAAFIDKENIALRDQLAEFYIRHRQYSLALQTWGQSLKPPSTDYIWLKTLFWSQVFHPIQVDWDTLEVPDGRLKPLVEYMMTFKPGQYWNHEQFEKQPELKQYLHSEQATFWLRLIDYLKDQKEEKALELLEIYPFPSRPVDRDLQVSLRHILNYRINGTFAAEETYEFSSDRHIFFKQMKETIAEGGPKEAHNNLSDELRTLLKSDEIYTVAFLSAGWLETALQLHRMPVIPTEFPSWLAYALTQVYHYNRSPLEALDFAYRQQTTEPLSVLIGELLIASGSPDAAIPQLTPFSHAETPIGIRAAWLITQVYMFQKKYDEAEQMVYANPMFTKETAGQEILARIAMFTGDMEKTESIYGNIIEQSREAKSYFARKAYTQKNWKRARELTQELLRESPNNLVLRQNLLKIIEQQKNDQ